MCALCILCRGVYPEKSGSDGLDGPYYFFWSIWISSNIVVSIFFYLFSFVIHYSINSIKSIHSIHEYTQEHSRSSKPRETCEKGDPRSACSRRAYTRHARGVHTHAWPCLLGLAAGGHHWVSLGEVSNVSSRCQTFYQRCPPARAEYSAAADGRREVSSAATWCQTSRSDGVYQAI